MKLKDAIEMGLACGLQTKAEAINNVMLHSMSLFRYDDIAKEEAELIAEAKADGVKFCKTCQSAMIGDVCYICRKFRA